MGSKATELKRPLGFDPAALREKYQYERDKRLRPEGARQYQDTLGEFSRYVDDPYVKPGFSREPLTDEMDIIIIGGGFGGLLVGARLREAGVSRSRVIEKAGDFGGTWYWNRYPGAQCDVESYVYLPLLEETGYTPRKSTPTHRKFSPTPRPLPASTIFTRTLACKPRSRTFAGKNPLSAGP
jgi:hypothetical protein